jgi:ketosteroid isomerase-like protein
MSTHLRGDDERWLERLEMSWDDVVARRDAAAFGGRMAEDYFAVGVDGEVSDKLKVIEAIAASDPQLKPHTRGDIQVRVYGDTALVTGQVTWRSPKPKRGRDCPKGECRARYLKVYVRREGEWQMVAAQATRIGKQ